MQLTSPPVTDLEIRVFNNNEDSFIVRDSHGVTIGQLVDEVTQERKFKFTLDLLAFGIIGSELWNTVELRATKNRKLGSRGHGMSG